MGRDLNRLGIDTALVEALLASELRKPVLAELEDCRIVDGDDKDRWLVVVAHPNVVDELQKNSDENVSFLDAAGEVSIFMRIYPQFYIDQRSR